MNKFLIILVFLLGIASCKKEEPCCDVNNPECPNYDPCYLKTVANAAFTFGEVCTVLGGEIDGPYLKYDSIIYSDTIYQWNTVEFAVEQQDYDSLKWFIGQEVLTTPTVRRRNFPAMQNVSVTLVVWKTPDSLCFPNATVSDTVTKTFFSSDHTLYREKRYKGVHGSAPNDSVWVSFVVNEPLGIPTFCTNHSYSGTSVYQGYKTVVRTTDPINFNCGNGNAIRMVGTVTGNKLHVDYKYMEGPGETPYVSDTFDGVLVP